MQWQRKRERMVAEQLRARGVDDEAVLAAMATVPRHAFVPSLDQVRAYADGPLGIGNGQTISQPYIVARMAELLELDGDSTVLEVGAGSGYAAAVMAEVADHVWAVEQDPELAAGAEAAVADWSNITVVTGDGRQGLPDHGPFDAVSVAAAAPEVPPALLDQLADGGRLVMPLGRRHGQVLTLVRREGDEFHHERHGRVRFVPLLGEE